MGHLQQDQKALRDRLNKLLEELRQHGLGQSQPGKGEQQGKGEGQGEGQDQDKPARPRRSGDG